MSDIEDVPEQTEKEEITESWISRCIQPCHNNGESCPFGCKGVHQHEYTARIVQKSNDPRTLLPVVKGILFGKLEPILFDPKIDPDSEACFNCWKIGKHTYKRCRKPKIHNFCINCGRRGVEIADCPRCAKGNEEYYEMSRGNRIQAVPPETESRRNNKRDKSRGRSNENSQRSRSRVRDNGRNELKNLRGKSCGPSRDTQNSNARGDGARNTVTFESRNSRDKSRGRMRNGYHESRDKSGYRDKKVTWSDSQDFNDNGFKSCDERKNRAEGNWKFNKNQDNASANNGGTICQSKGKSQSTEESGNNITRQYIELMHSIKHLPGETQNEMVKLFLKEREALIKTKAE